MHQFTIKPIAHIILVAIDNIATLYYLHKKKKKKKITQSFLFPYLPVVSVTRSRVANTTVPLARVQVNREL